MKFFIVLAALVALAFAEAEPEPETNVHEEGRSGGELFFRGNTGSKSAWEGSWQSKKVRYPIDGEYPAPIGFLKIINNMDSEYSTATIKEGGVGSNYAVIEYYAPAFRGYDYNVEIRGAKA